MLTGQFARRTILKHWGAAMVVTACRALRAIHLQVSAGYEWKHPNHHSVMFAVHSNSPIGQACDPGCPRDV
ncbi:hypothetical protein BD413DRAFT_512797 [Trametes elegans]|nr:hypothetical protein BD413DRAFT_512797 [Trametes elegans]